MMRPIACILIVAFVPAVFAEEELPKNPDEAMDIEPPLLIQEVPNQNVVYTRPDAPDIKPTPDIDQLEASLEKARKNAVWGERLYKSGAIAKVEAESKVLKVIKLEADLAAAKLDLARQTVVQQEARAEAGEIAASEVEAAKAAELTAMKEAESAEVKKKEAELAAAELNLRRQQKLFAMGSGRKSEVNRAQQKLSELQEKN